MTIKLGEFQFNGPDSLSTATYQTKQGIYTIMSKAPFNPNTYSVIYMGETSDFSERGFPDNHHAYRCWISQAGSKDALYIATLSTEGSSEERRKAIEDRLIGEYSPPCNKR